VVSIAGYKMFTQDSAQQTLEINRVAPRKRMKCLTRQAWAVLSQMWASRS